MRFVEDVVEDSRLIAIATGKQMPEIQRLQIGERSNKVAISAKRTIGVEPLKIQQRVSTNTRCPSDDSVEVLEVNVGTVPASTA